MGDNEQNEGKIEMDIGLVDVDGHNFPNVALMKISAYHKAKGDSVEWAGSLNYYDKVYMAKIFDFTPDDLQAYQADEIIKGGTGYNLASHLPNEIEHCFPDYSLYGITDTAYGYLTRGCPRNCPFCIVGKKEGLKSVKVANLSSFWNGQKNVKLLDPNLLACENWQELLQQLAASKAIVDFTQGLDARLLDDEKVAAINKCRYTYLHFAWDHAEDTITSKKLEAYAKSWNCRTRNCTVYVLTNYDSTLEQDLYRIYQLRDMGYTPYVMIYDKYQAPQAIRHLQRWCNNKLIFRSQPDFKKYDPKRG